MSSSPRTRAFVRTWRSHASGAALLETLVVLPVLLTIAFNALEFSRYGQAKMIVRYAQVQGMRECAVSGEHNHNPTGDANGNTLALNAATEALRPWSGKWFTVGAMPGCHIPNKDDENSAVDFPISATYNCSYPLSFCRAAGGMALSGLPANLMSMPAQTAFYDKYGSTPSDGLTLCAKNGARMTVELCDALIVPTDAGGPPIGPDCTGMGTQLMTQCDSCAAACTTSTCAAGCRSNAKTAAASFTSENSSCGSQVNGMVSTCGSCWNEGGMGRQCI